MEKSYIICFQGMDGSGKSTLSKYLYWTTIEKGHETSYTWWLDGEDSFIRKLIKKIGKKNPESESDRSTNNNLKNWGSNNKITKFLYNILSGIMILDYWRFALVKVTIPKKFQKKIMIFDRFYWDVVISMHNNPNFNFSQSFANKIMRVFRILVGSPDIIFFIDVSPEIALSRKKDEIKTMENAQNIWENCQEIYFYIKKYHPENLITIDGNNDLETVKSELLKYSQNVLGDLND